MRRRARVGNLLDLSLILLLVFCLLGVGLRHRMQKNGEQALVEEDFRVTLLLEGLPAEWPHCVKVGETLYLGDGTPFGELLSCVSEPSSVRLLLDGELRHVAWEEGELCDVRAEVLVCGRERDGLLLRAGGQALPVGGRLTLYSARAEWKATVAATSPLS